MPRSMLNHASGRKSVSQPQNCSGHSVTQHERTAKGLKADISAIETLTSDNVLGTG